MDNGLRVLAAEAAQEPLRWWQRLRVLQRRYDRHFGREMFSALALLLVLRRSGEAGLEDALASAFGVGG